MYARLKTEHRTAIGYYGWGPEQNLRITNITVPGYVPDEPEAELVFTKKAAAFYQVYRWFGRYLKTRARAIKVLEEKEAEWLRTAPGDSPFSNQGVYQRMLQSPRT